MRHRFRGRWWRILFRRLRKEDGTCCVGVHEIAVSTGIGQQRTLDVLIHEGLHACLPDLDEDAVAETAEDLAGLLWRLGWRPKI